MIALVKKAVLDNKWLAVWVSLAFLAVNLFAMVKGFFLLNAVPVGVVLALVTIYHPKVTLLFLVFFTPLSLNLEELESLGGVGFYLPTEPLLFGLMCLYIIKILYDERPNKDFLYHPLSIAIMVNLGWIFITSVTSTLPVVSFKFLLARLWFVLVLYFFINRFFRDKRFILQFIWAYIIALSLVIVYTVLVHAANGFSEEAAHWVMQPFYKDHTSYGALIAMFYPMLLIFTFSFKQNFITKTFLLGILAVFSVGLVLSYTRAAWVSLVGAAAVWTVIKLKIKFSVLVGILAVLFALFFTFQSQIIHQIQKNKQDSSDSLTEHVASITNVSSDASNLERLNRWNSALRMFAEKPILGFGPGTYMFTYGVHQKSSDKTYISTNLGDAGNAHSEYLGSLSESGVLGTVTLLIIIILSIVKAIRLYHDLEDKEWKGIVMGLLLGLITYYLHGLMNNFLDTDKASVPIWGFMSIIVAIDIYHRGNTQKNLQQSKAVSSK